MPKSKSLQNKIAKKLDQLSKLLDKIDEVRILNSDDSDTWDSDALDDLVENLKETLQLLTDKEDPKEKDPWGEPLILEEGLCTLMDEYHEEAEEEDFQNLPWLKNQLKLSISTLTSLSELLKNVTFATNSSPSLIIKLRIINLFS